MKTNMDVLSDTYGLGLCVRGNKNKIDASLSMSVRRSRQDIKYIKVYPDEFLTTV